MNKIDFFDSLIAQKAIDNVSEVLRSGQISEGIVVELFEKELVKRYGFPNFVTTNSGTSALHLALKVLGIGRGDEVIMPSQSFIATALAALYVGAKPVFADIGIYTGNIELEFFKAKVTENTKAVILVDWGGLPCDLDDFYKWCHNRGIKVIEDAAHSFGAMYKNRFVGAGHVDATCFSFQAIKSFTTGDGGGITFRLDENATEAKRLRWFGIDRKTDLSDELGERIYQLDFENYGYKYHMNNIAAAIGLGNLEMVDASLYYKMHLTDMYKKCLSHTPGVTFIKNGGDKISSHWLLTVLVENRLDFIRKLRERGIPTSVVHLGVHNKFGLKLDLPNQHIWDANHICLPIHAKIKPEQVDYICEVIREGW